MRLELSPPGWAAEGTVLALDLRGCARLRRGERGCLTGVEALGLAVRTGVWPLKEYVDGKTLHTKVRRPRLPVERYLKEQGRFAHLFHPNRKDEVIAAIQARVDAYWARVGETR